MRTSATALDGIRAAIAADPGNAAAAAHGWKPVYVAAPGARIVLIGQAPGRAAQESGVPWNDASGRVLLDWLGVSEERFRDPDSFAILPMDFYYPGRGPSGDLPPRRDVAPRWHPAILAELREVRLTILVGAYAQRFHLGPRAKRTLTETVQAFRDYLPAEFPLVHPSPLNFRWQGRNPWFREELLPELRAEVARALA
jgi:uracil-DNA glycosylase